MIIQHQLVIYYYPTAKPKTRLESGVILPRLKCERVTTKQKTFLIT